ncbi:FIST signal transduction protein [Roseobacter sp. HKCCA0434]|uniref:FIST signal transduction protein n=1 Tax=Roseobacter sp. HKCCA0434 TaxID=3079297 RepID=UPI002905BF66|nr:FIST N-terminal domain-containing protein [Roseobacter sp. HKCCA0434]
MEIDVFAAGGLEATALSQSFDTWLARHETAPDLVVLTESVGCEGAGLAERLTGIGAVHGSTSCLGVMSQDGPHIVQGAGAFGIWDPTGDYGSAMRPFGNDARGAARAALDAALLAADRPGEAPDLIWLSSSPGREEEILSGIAEAVGENVPVLGGSAADDDVSGNWRVFDAEGSAADGVVISVLFPSTRVSFAYHNGYAPTAHAGTVTSAEGRLLREIDGRPAAQVYRDWTGPDLIPSGVEETTAILSESTLTPLGLFLDRVGDVPYYLLAHPAGMTPEGHLELFADVAEGDELTLMSGSPDRLTERAGKVASLAVQAGGGRPEAFAGALVIYCGGCMLAVQDRLEDVTSGLRDALPGVPFLGSFTFGEQGVVLDGRNRHGNLMISAVLFEA